MFLTLMPDYSTIFPRTLPYQPKGTTTPTTNAIIPTPQPGIGAFGMVPGPIPTPNPAGDLGAQYPGLGQTNAVLSSDILAQLGGRLSPGTLKAMQDYEAGLATRSGMPGTNAMPGTIGYNRGVRDIGTTAEAQIRAGQQAYNQTIPTVSRTQTVSPELQATIAGTNASNAAAPNPAMAASYAQQLYDQYLQRLRGPGGGTTGTIQPGGGTGTTAADWRNSLVPPPTSTGTAGGAPAAGTGTGSITATGPDGNQWIWDNSSGVWVSPTGGDVRFPSEMNPGGTAANTTDLGIAMGNVYNPADDTYSPVDLGY